MHPPLSIIIPTLNEERYLGPLLERLMAQKGEADEIIIVDSHSKDRTREIAQGHGARVILRPKEGIGKAKTDGAKEAGNGILVFLDADAVPSDDFLLRIRRHFADGSILAVGGLDIYQSDSKVWKTIYDSYSKWVFHSARITHSITGKYWIPANNCAYRKDHFFSVGGFRSVVCEDTDMMYRMPASRKVVYDGGLLLELSDRRFKEAGFFRTVGLWGISNVAAFFDKGLSTDGYRKD